MDENGTTRPSFGFLDLMVLVAESWLALVLTPLAFAAVAFFAVNAAPHKYESYADVDAPTEAVAVVATRSYLEAIFGDPLVVSAYGDQLAGLQAQGAASFRVDVLGSGSSSRISAQNSDSARSEALVSAVISHLPRDVYSVADTELRRQSQLAAEIKVLARLERALEQLDTTLVPAGAEGEGVAPTSQAVEYATAVGLLLNDIRESELSIETLGGQLAAVTPRDPLVVTRNIAIPMTNAVIFAAFLGLILVLAIQSARASLRHARSDPATTAKLQRIRRGLRLGRGPAS